MVGTADPTPGTSATAAAAARATVVVSKLVNLAIFRLTRPRPLSDGDRSQFAHVSNLTRQRVLSFRLADSELISLARVSSNSPGARNNAHRPGGLGYPTEPARALPVEKDAHAYRPGI